MTNPTTCPDCGSAMPTPRQYGMYFITLRTIPLDDVNEALATFAKKYGDEPRVILYHKEDVFPPTFSGTQTVERTNAVEPGHIWIGNRK
jgi:hypothetical protein